MILAKEFSTQPWVIAGCEYSYIWFLWMREYKIASNEAEKTLSRLNQRKAKRPGSRRR